ncbi:P-loop containing nucleoside triphosphate hydrolase protein [Exidia glandulosa HHB12029]|uniref:ATP-dependent DNA helicase n=1 Tax=Exidia glandulosa HHB12029 TaxID=1314781 RepID=A0A165PCB5_EXIGL|nr:P-loop containing nucleoside triphosphate hydrolase protein [Exidia glandulosa HHB12029]
MSGAVDAMSLDSDDMFDDDVLAQLDAIDAAHVQATQRAPATQSATSSTAMPTTQQPADDDADMTFDFDDSMLDAIDPPAPSTSARPAPAPPPAAPRTLTRTTSQQIQTTLTGEPFNASGSSNKPRAMPKAGKFSKTKKWDHTAFAKSGRKGSKKKGADKTDGEEVEIEQFPAPFVPVGQPQPMKPQVDRLNARKWIYPLNREKRDYQRAIAEAALFENTLVALPTGLGKTFIAGVVMLNFYLWFPTGKIIFVAPTKPLVAQQIVACHEVCGIPGQDAAEMHGEIKASKRALLWEQKRVFYMTPQTLQNDITSENFDIRDVVLLVIDEAHRATGEYAYCTVVRHLMAKNPHFRVLALTATPSSDKDKIQPIVDALHISHIEIRSEASPDIIPYIKKKELTKHVIEIPAELGKLRDGLAKVMLDVLQPMIKRLGHGILHGQLDPVYLKPFSCKAAMDRLHTQKNVDRSIFPTLMNLRNLATTMGYLLEYSPRLALEHLEGRAEVDPSKPPRKPPAYKDSRDYREVVAAFKDAERRKELIHPKMKKLRDLLREYFVRALDSRENSKAMVFVSFRSCVEEIVEYLSEERPLIRATKFIGQGDDKAGKKGLSQKEQLAVIERFKKDEFNVLISTSIGEEGLDIGEVDLIVCYETTSSAIRSLQRAGRTGRKRNGRLDLLMTEGREEANWDRSTDKYEDVQYAIRMAQLELYCDVERLIPPEFTPVCVERPMEIEPYERVVSKKSGGDDDEGGGSRKGSKKKAKDPQRNVPEGASSGFVAASQLVAKGSKKRKKDGDDEDDEEPKKTTKKAKKQEELTYSQIMAELEASDDEPPQSKRKAKAKASKKSATSRKKGNPEPELSYSQVQAELEISDDEPPLSRPTKGKGKAKASQSKPTSSRATSKTSSRATSRVLSPPPEHSIVDLCDSSVVDLCDSPVLPLAVPRAPVAEDDWILGVDSDVEMAPPSPKPAPLKPSLTFQSARNLVNAPTPTFDLDSDVEVVVSTPARNGPLSPSALVNSGHSFPLPQPSFRKPAPPAPRPHPTVIPSSPDLFTQPVRAPGQAARRTRTAGIAHDDDCPAPSTSQARLEKFKCPRVRKAVVASEEDDPYAEPVASQTRLRQFVDSADSSSPPRPPVKRHRVRADPVRRAERNDFLDTVAVHSGDEDQAGDTSASDEEEDEEDRRFVTEMAATQADPDYDQSMAYRHSLFTQAPVGRGPAFRSGPVRTNSHLNARERGRKRAPGVSSSPPRDPNETLSDYEMDSFLVADDDPLVPLSSEP